MASTFQGITNYRVKEGIRPELQISGNTITLKVGHRSIIINSEPLKGMDLKELMVIYANIFDRTAEIIE